MMLLSAPVHLFTFSLDLSIDVRMRRPRLCWHVPPNLTNCLTDAMSDGSTDNYVTMSSG
jgi:hypothetical protein